MGEYIYNHNGSECIRASVLKGAVEDDEDFRVAHYLVCKFVTKRKVTLLHRKIIGNVGGNLYTLDLAPRGFGKSTIGDVDFCITKILRDPEIRIMIGSKTQTQAEAFLKEIREHFESNMDLIEIFGDLRGKKWTDKEFTISNRKVIKKEATVTALGSSGQVVSKHFDIIVGDDLVGFENARTESQRAKLREWFYSALRPTLEPHGEFHILGTRYHPNDLYQDLIDSGNYNVAVQKAINKEEDGTELSLWEEKFSLETLIKIRRESGQIIFAMQYQNETELAKGKIFKAKNFRYYSEYMLDKEGNVSIRRRGENGEDIVETVRVYMGVDLAIGEKETNDYFVNMAIGVDKDMNIYVLDYVQERLTFGEQFNQILNYGYNKFPSVVGIGVESVAYQKALARELKRGSSLPIYELNTSKDKTSRAMRRSALFESGKVFFRSSMMDLEECLLLFPEGEHDDLFDGLELAITQSEKGSSRGKIGRDMFRI